MYSNIRKNLILSAGISLVALLTATAPSLAQSPAASPTPTDSDGRFTVTSSAEFGVRGLEVNGNHDKFRSDLNYHAGFRVFDSSILIKDNSKGSRVFDTALVTASGWSSDPQGSFRLNMDKVGSYSFDANLRRVTYFNNLNTHVVNWSQQFPTGSEHAMNTVRNFGDMDLTVFPQSEKFRMRFGYSFNHTDGPGFATLRFGSIPGGSGISGVSNPSADEFQVNSSIDSTSQDFRAGVEGKLAGFNLGFSYGHRAFNDKTQFFVDALNQGNNPTVNTASINLLTRLMPVKGTTDFGNFYAQRTFAKKLDFTGRFIYAESNTKSSQSDIASGRVTNTQGTFVNLILDTISSPGTAKRPQARGDMGLTWRPVDRFRVSNTFTFDQFSISGESFLTELVQRTTTTGSPLTDRSSISFAFRDTSYRRFSDLIEGDYQVNRMFAFNVGYRYTHRKVGLEDETFTNTTHSVIAGTRIKPNRSWSIYADVEHGSSDNVFTRLANNKFTNFRVRSVANLKQFSFNLSAITKDNDNPGRSTAVTAVPATDTIANTKTRIFSGSVDWTPRSELSLSGGYTYNWQTTFADIILPVGAPDFPTSAYRLGISSYYLRDSYFFVDVTARPIKRVSLFASYRLDDDPGQGDRVLTRAQDILTSYPIRFHMPEVRLAIKLTRNIDWNLGYQYYSYSERQYINAFATSNTNSNILTPQGIAPQNYTAHMPYTSLRIYFGKGAGDR